MKVYLDTNFLLRLYLDYEGSARAVELISGLGPRDEACPMAWLQQVEYANALQLMVFQSRGGALPRISNELAAIAQQNFDEDLARGRSFREVTLGAGELAAACRGLSARHTAILGCRTYDLIHVAAALRLDCSAFWSFDTKASRLAQREGLKVL